MRGKNRNRVGVCVTILLTLLLVIHFHAQCQVIIGRVVDKKNHPIEFANVALYALPDSSLVAGTITDIEGAFTLPNHHTENCFLRASFVGYKTQTTNISANIVIVLDPETELLNEVTVTATRPNISSRKGVLTTTVAGTMLAKERSLTDLLGKIPGIINYRGAISVFGGGRPIYYIDNRRVHSNFELSMIDVRNIRKVELLTNPGAKYGAGVTAVVKIYTMRHATGFSVEVGGDGSLSERFSHNEHASIGYKTSNLNLSAYYGFYDYRNRSHQFSIQEISGDTVHQYSTDSRQLPRSWQHDYSLSADWEIRSGQTVGARLIGSCTDAIVASNDHNLVRRGGMVTDEFDSPSSMRQVGTDVQLNVFHNADWSDRFSTSINADYVTSRDEKFQTVNELMARDTVLTDSKLVADYDIYAADLMADWKLSEAVSLSFGVEYSRIDGRSRHLILAGRLPDSHYKSTEDKSAGYADLALNFTRWTFGAGLRYERIARSHTDLMDAAGNLHNTDTRLFPSASISYTDGRFNTALTLSTKTDRPALSYLSSRTYYQSRFVYQKGNPLLKPQTSCNLEWSFGWRWLSLRAGYTHINDYITSTLIDDPTLPNSIVNTWQNFPKAELWQASIDLRRAFGPWSPSLSAGVVKPRLKSVYMGEAADYNAAGYYVLSNHYLKLPIGITFNLDFYYNSGGNQGIYRFDPYWSIGAGLHKSFLADQLEVKLSTADLFHTLDYYERARINHFSFYQNEYYAQWNFTLSVVYRLNQQQLKYRGRSAAQDEKRRL